MKKLFKTLKIISTVVISLIILLIVGSVITLNIFLQPQHIKNLLIKQTAEQTGRQLTIGDFSWSLFPTLHINLSNVSLSNPTGFAKQPFFTINQVDIGVKFAPLLNRQFETSSVKIDGLNLALIQNQAGIGNWQGKSKTHASTSISEKGAAATIVAYQPLFYYIPAIDIENINMSFLDQKTGKTTFINNLNFHAKNIQNHQAFPFKLNVDFSQSDPKLEINAQSDGDMLIKSQQLYLQHVNFSSHVVTDSMNSKLNFTDLNTIISNRNNVIYINPLNAKLYNGTLNSIATINLKNNSYYVNGNLDNIDAQALLKDLNDYDQFTGLGNVQFILQTHGQQAPQLINNLNGHIKINFTQSQYLGVDIGYLYRNALMLVLQGKFTIERHSSITKLGNLSADFNINNGIMETNNLLYLSPILRVTGIGSANLSTQQLVMRLHVIGMKGSMDNLKENGPAIPFNVGGTFSDPKVRADLGEIFKTQVQDKIENKIKQGLDHLPIDTQKIKDDLKSLF